MRGVFQVEAAQANRLAYAVENLEKGDPFMLSDVLFRLEAEGTLVVEAVSAWGTVDAVTRETAPQELARGHSVFDSLLDAERGFRELIERRPPRFAVIVDAELTSFEVCRETASGIAWAR